MFGRWFNAGGCDTGSKSYSSKKHGWDKDHNDKFDFGKCFDKKKFSWDRSEDKKIDCGFNKSKHHDRDHDHSDKGGSNCDLWGSSKHHKSWDKKIDCSKFSIKSHDHDKGHSKSWGFKDEGDKAGCGEQEESYPNGDPKPNGPPLTPPTKGVPCDCDPDEDEIEAAPAPKAPAYEACDGFDFFSHHEKKTAIEHDHKNACDIDFSWGGHHQKAPTIDPWGCEEIVVPTCEIPEIETNCWSFEFHSCFSFC